MFPFGHGLSYTTYEYADLALSARSIGTDGEIVVSCTVRNTGDRSGEEIVQLYLHDVTASVTRPVKQLVGFARVPLEEGGSARVSFRVHADLTSFTRTDLRRVVEPGAIEVFVGPSSGDLPLRDTFQLSGPTRVVGHDRVMTSHAEVVTLDQAASARPDRSTQ
jgi:beta-glucosidase